MLLPSGTRVGPYEIVSHIGSGGMGDVYRARDSRLGRDIAIKVLPASVAADADRIARFEREARAVAAINHPNIVALYDVGTADVRDSAASAGSARVTYLVTELLDGETLRAALDQEPLSIRKAADVGMQIARGLAAAHDRGIVHRDLKPENVVLTRDGHVKILDFGLAKSRANEDEQGAAGVTRIAAAATDAGTIMGTVGYMAPEQVRGDAADPRTDVFAVGVVLYELVSGKRAFQRETAAETMTAILREDPPDLSTTRADVPRALERIVRHCLEKSPQDRFQSARDLAFALQTIADAGSGEASAISVAAASASVPVTGRREQLAWLIAGALGLACAGLLIWRGGATTSSPASASRATFAFTVPSNDAAPTSPAISPDSQRIAFTMGIAADESIWIRTLDATKVEKVPGTAGVRIGAIAWSPDGRSLAFLAAGKLKTIDLASGSVNAIADAPTGYGLSWGPDGTILFSPDERTPILRVNAKGGPATPVTALDASRSDQAHRWPQFLPDGRHFVFMPWTSGTVTRPIQLASLDGAKPATLFESKSAPVVAGQYLVYVQEGPSQLLAQRLDKSTFAPVGPPVRVVEDDNVDFIWAMGYPMLAATPDLLIYTTGKVRLSRLTWFDRGGRPLGTLGEPDGYFDPAISVDGMRLAIEQRTPTRDATDLWTVDLARGAFSRLTSTPGYESVATWSPDGRRIAFASDQDTMPKIFVKNADGTGAAEAIVEGRSFPMDWSRDGRRLLYSTQAGATQRDIWQYDFERRAATPLLATPFNEQLPRLSPDGKWMAYVSDEGQGLQVYVRSFPDLATKVQVSTAGGNEPQWRGDSQELFYLAPDSALMAATVHARGSQLSVDVPQWLFPTKIAQVIHLRCDYAPTSDGQRFLVKVPLVDPKASKLTAVLNWTHGLKK